MRTDKRTSYRAELAVGCSEILSHHRSQHGARLYDGHTEVELAGEGLAAEDVGDPFRSVSMKCPQCEGVEL